MQFSWSPRRTRAGGRRRTASVTASNARAARRSTGALVTAVALIAGAPALEAQGLGYTLTPAATSIRWTDALGLNASTLLGGQVGFDFERYVTLQGYYFTNDGVRTAVDKFGLTGDLATRLANQKLDIRTYGANLLLNLGTGTIVPFIKGGGGVIEFRPQTAIAGTVTAGPTRQAALTLGGGLQLNILGPVRLDLFAEDLMFRVNRYTLAAQILGAPSGAGQIPPDPEESKTRHNLTLGAGLSIPLGASRDRSGGPSQLYQWGLSGTSYALEPIAGRLFFSNDQGIGDQDVAGLRAGFDVGRLVGLRGFYWRGTNSGFTRTEPVESWGGEAQLRLNSGQGVTPFLLLGGARLDFKDAFRATDGSLVEDQNALIAGGGVTFPLSERVGVNLSARDYVYGQSTLDSVATLKDLKSSISNNWLISAGLRFSIGGHSGQNLAERRATELRELESRDRRLARADSMRTDSMARAGVARKSTDSVSRARAELAGARRDTTVIVSGTDTLRVLASDTIRLRENAGVPATRLASAATDSIAVRNYATDRLVTIPVPAEGELYVRYGPPGSANARAMSRGGEPLTASGRAAMSEPELRQTMRTMLRDEVAAEIARTDASRGTSRTQRRGETTRLTDEQLAAIENRVLRRMSEGEVAPRATAHADVRYPVRKPDTASRVSPPVTPVAPVTPRASNADIDARIDARLSDRLDRIVDQRVRDELARRPRDTVVVRTSDTTTRVDTLRRITQDARGRGMGLMGPNRVTLYSGGTVSSGNQGLLGLRADVGPINRSHPGFRLVPEIAFGFGGGGRSTLLAGNVQYRFPSFHIASLPGIAPHVSAGLGLLNFSEPVGSHDGWQGVLDLGYGATVDLWPRESGTGPALLVEHQGVDLYDISRLLVGIAWRF